MKLTSKARYAVMAVADLALYSYLERSTIVLREIADRQDISISYLEQLFAKLRKKKIVKSMRGPGGGYYLARDVNEISVWEIITAVDETIELSRCDGAGDCIHGEKCITHNLWNELTKTISNYLQTTTIGSIIRDHLSDDSVNEDILERLTLYRLQRQMKQEFESSNKKQAESSKKPRANRKGSQPGLTPISVKQIEIDDDDLY